MNQSTKIASFFLQYSVVKYTFIAYFVRMLQLILTYLSLSCWQWQNKWDSIHTQPDLSSQQIWDSWILRIKVSHEPPLPPHSLCCSAGGSSQERSIEMNVAQKWVQRVLYSNQEHLLSCVVPLSLNFSLGIAASSSQSACCVFGFSRRAPTWWTNLSLVSFTTSVWEDELSS